MDSAGRSFSALLGAFSLVLGCGICAAAGLVLGPASAPAIAAVLLAGVASARALGAGRRALRADRRLREELNAVSRPLPPRLRDAAAAAGLEGRVSLLDLEESSCFVHGALTPRVAISRGLLARLSEGELRAVLEHERYHVGAADPLRGVIAEAIVAAFVSAPPVRALLASYEASREMAADRRAARCCGRRDLAGALLKSLAGDPRPPSRLVHFGGAGSILEERIGRIEAAEGPAPAPGRRLPIAPMAIAAALGQAGLAAAGPQGPALLAGLALCAVPVLAAGALAVVVCARRANRPL